MKQLRASLLFVSVLLLSFFPALHVCADGRSLIPLPQKFVAGKGWYVPQGTKVQRGPAASSQSAASSSQSAAFAPLLTDEATLQAVASGRYSMADERYALRVTPEGVEIDADSPLGELRGRQTLQQLLDAKGRVACCEIEDSPAYEWRGAMIDVSRHFFSIDFLKKQVDVLAAYKVNRLHLHLTDAAGWRVEIKRYPRLTRVGAFRTSGSWKTWWNGRPALGIDDPLRRKYVEEGQPGACGGYYTQDELRDLVSYAAARGVTIVPEIEMPAHSEEVLTAYPELSCTHEPYRQADFCPGSVATYDFLEHVLEEVMDIFPSRYIHVGGDEAAKASWATCPRCRQKMLDLGILPSETSSFVGDSSNATGDTSNAPGEAQTYTVTPQQLHKLQAHLIAHMGHFLQQHGRQLVGWDEVIDETLSKNTTVMVWRNAAFAADAVRNGYDVILSPGSHCYLDGYQDAPNRQPEAMGGFTTLEKVYGFVPGEGLEAADRAAHVKGVQGNLWTEYVPTEQHVEYMLYPRMLALAEIGWNGTAVKDYAAFRRRALAEVKCLRDAGVNAFDLSREVGNRVEYSVAIAHKARGAKVSYAPAAPYNTTAYAAAGDAALTDGLRGSWNYGDGRWQGFIGGKDYRFDVTIDLGEVKKISSVATDFMQMCGPEIFYPEDYVVSVSTDGEHFRRLGAQHHESVRTDTPDVMTFRVAAPARARYVRVQASPSAFGGWLFADEVVVK